MRNFWYLAVLTLVIGTLIIFLARFGNFHHPPHSHPSGLIMTLGLIGPFGRLLLDAVTVAAILGLLRKDSLEKTAWAAAGSSITNYTWTLFRLLILIGLIFIPFALLIGLAVSILGANKFILIFAIGFYLVLIKYALADPLVVVENLGAWDALKRSWEMTKGHFRYVMGCYLFLGLGAWLIIWLISLPFPDADNEMSLPVEFASHLIDSLWIVLSWSMYVRIKEAEAQA